MRAADQRHEQAGNQGEPAAAQEQPDPGDSEGSCGELESGQQVHDLS